MPRDAERPKLTPERRALLDRIVAEGTGRRRNRLVGAGATLVLVLGLVSAVTVVGERDQGRQILAIGGTGSTPEPPTSAPPADPGVDPAGDPAGTTTVPSVPPLGTGGPSTTAPSSTSTTVAPPATLPGTWAALPPSGVPPRFGGARAWTGRELLVWGGIPRTSDACDMVCGEPAVFDGVAFDPVRNAWRRMAPGPVPAGGAPTQIMPGGAWTGSELVVWGGDGTPVSAAYDPDRDTWRTLPAGPLVGGFSPGVVAMGGEVYVVRSGAPGDAGPGAAALDPSTGTWRVLPDPPANTGVVVATAVGGEAVVVLRGPGYAGTVIAALAPGGSWRVIGSFPITVDIGDHSAAIAGGRAWLVECGILDGNVARVTVMGVDLATGTVTDRAGPLEQCPQLVAGGPDLVVLTPVPDHWQPQSLRAHQATADGWRELTPTAAAHVGEHTWTGTEVLFWGGCACGGMGGPAIEGGYRLRL